MKFKMLVLWLVLFTVAPACVAQTGAQRISYAQYGFEFSLPQGFAKTPVPHSSPDGWTEVYIGGTLAAGIGAGKMTKQENPATGADELARKMGAGRTSFTTPQGVKLEGVSGAMTLTKEMMAGLPPSMRLRPGMSIRLSAYLTILPTDRTRMMAIFVAGPGERGGEVDSLAQSILNSLTFTGLKPAETTAASTQAQAGGPALSKGEIALYGRVESVEPEAKSLKMLADKVVPYGQQAAVLDPARQKMVKYSQLPDGVAAGSRILVIGKNAGTGKPMTAKIIRLETPAVPAK